MADKLSEMSPKAAGQLAEALCRALGIAMPRPAIQQVPLKPIEPVKTEFTVILNGFEDSSKVAVIKLVREQKGLGLIESKTFVEKFPSILAEEVSNEEAVKLKDKFEAIGGRILIQ
jgi:ribosomal protein L7/L12